MILGLLAGLASADVWEDLGKYHYGDEPNTAKAALDLLVETPRDQLGSVEAKLSHVVADKNATEDGKAFACRMLQRIGTDNCVPAVATVLTDEKLCGYARLVLQRLEGSEKAAAALRDALDAAPDAVKVGIVGSIGEIRDTKAVPQVASLAGSKNPKVAAAAMMALGKIADKDAAAALQKLQAPEALRQAYLDALVDCARRLGGADAAPLAKKALEAKSPAHYVAGMQCLAAADPKAGVAMIVEALGSDAPRMRRGALDAVVIVKGEQLTQAVVAALGDLPAARQADLITALGSRGDPTALDAVCRYVGSKDLAIRDAAIGAAGRLGDARTVALLLGLDAMDAVKQALARMQAEGVDDALIQALDDGKTRAVAIQALAARQCATAAPKLLALVKDKDPAIRKEAWAGVAALGTEADMAAVMKAAAAVKDEDELAQALKAVKKVYATVADRKACFASLAGMYDAAQDPVKETLLGMAPAAGDDAALALVRQALKSDSSELQKAAVRALSAWPSKAAADDLYRLATTADDPVQRVLALRGYIALAASEDIRMSANERIDMLKKAAGQLKRDDEKKLIISGLAQTRSTAAFPMLIEYMKEDGVAEEAELAVANLLWETRNSKSKTSTDLAEKLLESKQSAVRDRVGAVISEWSKFKSYITTWLVVGPFKDKGPDGKPLFESVFPAESGAKDVVWAPLEKGIGRETIDLERQLGGIDHCCAYVKTTITLPADQKVRLEMGSDDAIKAWVNGELVHSNKTNRGCKPGQDVVTVPMKKGKNALMLKIVDDRAQWAFSCRIRTEKGTPVEGLEASAE